jgi:prophage antirepressor-like protein
MSELTKVFRDNKIRVSIIAGEPWFVAADVCAALGIADTSQAVSRLDDDEKLMRTLDVSGQGRETWTVNESGIYALILRSNKPEAKPFRKWITSEVLPSIRKTGVYSLTPEARKDSAAARTALTQNWKEHGADKFYHYINLTRAEYLALFGNGGRKKADMNAEEIAALRFFEAMENFKLVTRKDIHGYEALNKSIKDTGRMLPDISSRMKAIN